MKALLTSAAAAIILASCASIAPGGAASSAQAASAPVRAAGDYVRMAGASDLYEIQSSQAVLQSTQNADVRRFAQMMVDHHTMTTRDVVAAAQAAGMTPPPPQLDAPKAALLRELQQASGAARDGVYLRQQMMAHQEALALHSGYAQGGDNAALRAVAGKAVPIIQQHLAELQRMNAAR